MTPLGNESAAARDAAVPWSTIIQPSQGALDWRLGELWRARHLVVVFVWRDFIALYKQTVLGPLWHLVQPLLTTLTYTVVFGLIVGVSTNDAPPFLFYLAGNVVWSYFASCLTKTATTLVANSSLLGKVYFHRLVIPVAATISGLMTFAIQATLFFFLWCYHWARGSGVHPTAWLAALPLVLLVLGGYGLGGGIIVSALTTRYRDLAVLVNFGTQLLMFATPVIYPLSAVPERFRWLVALNPLAPLIETFRVGFLGGTVPATHLAISCSLMPVVLLAGLALFSRVERTFMDTV